jgi:S1-C subfamily serine protease
VADERGTWNQLVPRTAMGLASLLFFMSIAAAASGGVLFAYYRFELDETKARVGEVEGAIAGQVESAQQLVDTRKDEALAQIDDQLSELEQFSATGATLDEIRNKAAPSVFFVSTLDVNGAPSVGTAWVVFSDGEQSFLLTSFSTIHAATTSPGPAITVTQNGNELPVTLNGWDEGRDLALLVADRPSLPALEFADAGAAALGDRLFAVSGLGGAGASVVQGTIADVSAEAIQHTVPIGSHFRGSPMLDGSGKVVAIASRRYTPLNFEPIDVLFAVPVRGACDQVVRCP